MNIKLKSKILLITEYVPHYRIPIYNLLSQEVNLTVIHSQKELRYSNFNFNNVYINRISIGPFSFFKMNLNKFCKKFDVVIGEGNIRFLDRNLLILWPWRKYRWISWGIGQAASYNKKLQISKVLLKSPFRKISINLLVVSLSKTSYAIFFISPRSLR